LRESPPDIVVLDWNLPGESGVEFLRDCRARGANWPVLLLTARDAVEDRVEGLDAGADDYLVKPYSVAELLARVRALLRRAGAEAPRVLRVGDIELDPVRRRASRGGELLDLTTKEFEILQLLLQNAGRPVSRQTLAREVWNDVPRATPLDNVIEVHVARLRRKVDDGRDAPLIRTVRGVGYQLAEPSA
jgi:DNA-binding response OmpR family regulator